MKLSAGLFGILCLLLATCLPVVVHVADAESRSRESSESERTFKSQSSDYFYSDDFSTRKAEMDAYQHSPFVDSLPEIFSSGLLMYTDYAGHKTLGFYEGFMPDAYAYLCYEFPLEGDWGVVTSGTLEVYLYPQGFDPVFNVFQSCDGSVWEPAEIAGVFGRFDLTPSPEDSCRTLFLMLSGGKTLMDSLSLHLTFSGNTDVGYEESESEFNLDLYQNYPNPFNPTTSMEFSLPRQGLVRIEIFNILGQKVRTAVDEDLKAGRHFVEWDGTDDSGREVSSGIYFYKLEAGDLTQTKKMVLIR